MSAIDAAGARRLLIGSHGVDLLVFPFAPPHIPLFQDGSDGSYGLPRDGGGAR